MSNLPHRPNILFVNTDQQRHDHLGCAGHPALRTPHIDRIAAGGLRLRRHYCNHPICSPSRATMITGRYPRSHRLYDNGCNLPESEMTLPAHLGMHGYTTKGIGKLHLSSWREPNAVSFESESFWASGKAPTEPVPYAGFQTVEICTRHINPLTGHYGTWLKNTHPEVRAKWNDFLTPHPSGANECSDWTMPPEAHANTWIADRTVDFLESHPTDDSPFFLHVGFPDPHHPFRAPEPWGSLYDPNSLDLPETFAEIHDATRPPEYAAYRSGRLNYELLGAGDFNDSNLHELTPAQMRVILAKTLGMISFVDAQIGRILDALDKSGHAKNTIVVFTSDHGDYMGDHGLILKAPLLLEGLVHVPFLIAVPGGPSNETCEALTAHVDLVQTFCDLCGVPPPDGVEGRSFAPLLCDRPANPPPRDRVLVEILHQFQPDRNVKSLITPDWKLIYWGGQDYGELYHLSVDPCERHNLWDDPSHSATRATLIRQLLDELLATENVLPRPLAPT